MMKDPTPSRTARMSKRGLLKTLRTSAELICMTPPSYATALSTAIQLMTHGENITCKITKGWELTNGLAQELNAHNAGKEPAQ